MEPSEPPSEAWQLPVLAGLLLLSMFFSASETAFFSASKLHIRYLTEKKHAAAIRLERILRRKDIFLNTILVGNNVVNITTSAIITSLAVSAFHSGGVGIATAIATLLILIFGEILPKSAALHWPEQIALRFSLPVRLAIFLLSPLVLVFSGATRILCRLMGIQLTAEVSPVTEEDLKTLIEVGEEEGVLEGHERAMMHKIFRYTDLTARDIMTPRVRIASVPMDITLTDALNLARDSHFSRFPVYGEDIDDIKGILYIKDILFMESSEHAHFNLRRILRPALFIFEGRKISAIQRQLRSANQNMAIIVDEYGGTAGIVTTEDLVEEIFGGIRDEFDGDEPAPIQANPEVMDIDGATRLDELSERLGITMESDFYDTIGGYLMEITDDMPRPGNLHEEQGYLFNVTSVAGRRILSIRVTKTGEEE